MWSRALKGRVRWKLSVYSNHNYNSEISEQGRTCLSCTITFMINSNKENFSVSNHMINIEQFSTKNIRG